jgi:TPR repeat protein
MRGLALFLALLTLPLQAPAQGNRLDFAFLPPAVTPQDICTTGATPDDSADPDPETETTGTELTPELRLSFIQRDIRNYQASDAARWFDFIQRLIDWQATLDPAFAGTGEALARIALYIDAGRLDDLADIGLIDAVRQGPVRLTNAQRLAIAQYYLTGTGVPQDRDLAFSLMREAAYGGNPDALLAIARFILDGQEVPGWDAPLDMTVSLAFGGMLGQMNADVCARAERIAQFYLSGDIVAPNPDIARDWFRFAADLGGATAAWRMVEYHLDAPAPAKDNAEMLAYLRLAVERGVTVSALDASRLRETPGVETAELQRILGFNHSADQGRTRPSLSHHFQLSAFTVTQDVAAESPYLQYLRELVAIEGAPGDAFTRLAQEIMLREGRWAAETQAMALLEEAAFRGDPDGMMLLARMLLRYRDDPRQLDRAINLNLAALDRHGATAAMDELDAIARCQAPDAPRMEEAAYWAQRYAASQTAAVTISPGDLLVLDPFKDPETIAQIQAQALDGLPASLAAQTQRVQVDPVASDTAHRLWASRITRSAKALEVFADLEYTLATNPAERDLAIELFRRVYLNNGVTTALDLSVALVEDSGRDPAVAAEIVDYLTRAGNRGEGAAIRLLARLTADRQSEAEVHAQFAEAIETRGDFNALTFAIPHVDAARAEDYLDRAVSLMTCGSKNVGEMADAHAILGQADMVQHWTSIGLAIEGGHVLAKLSISDRQMAFFDAGPAPSARDVAERARAEGAAMASLTLFDMTADPGLPGYDPAAAAGHLIDLLAVAGQETQALAAFRHAPEPVRAAVEARIDMGPILLSAANRGDAAAVRDYGLHLRDTATSTAGLQEALRWIEEAAAVGDTAAMTAWGEALAFGLGVAPDRTAALSWLERAERAGDPDAARLARLLRLGALE